MIRKHQTNSIVELCKPTVLTLIDHSEGVQFEQLSRVTRLDDIILSKILEDLVLENAIRLDIASGKYSRCISDKK